MSKFDMEQVEVQKVATELALATIKIMEGYGNEQFIDQLVYTYLSIYVSKVISNSLSEKVIDAKTKKGKYKQAKDSFSRMKSNTELAVSEGFQKGLGDFAGTAVGYYCLIRPIPEPINAVKM